MKKIFDVLNVIKQKLFVKKDKIHSEKYYRRIDFLNKYSLLFHAIIAMAIVFIVEIISRRSFISACKFVDAHTLASCNIFQCLMQPFHQSFRLTSRNTLKTGRPTAIRIRTIVSI